MNDPTNNKIVSASVPISIEEEMRSSYLDYAMSVIVSRAIPDACDGLKPVHRRILYAMHESGCDWNRPYRKSARIVGEVMGKYHPHGDGAIYQSLVRMAQDFSLRVPLVDGQGNFGSMDGDSAAAMRYTESRLAKVSHSLLEDIDKETVDFHDNYDGSEREPEILPARFPNLLVNGGGGIAVGMATNIPPHNLGEIIDASIAYLEDKNISDEAIMEIVPGPDFPTGGIILGRVASRKAVKTGRGTIIVRGRAHFEDIGNRRAIVITEIPYQVNKSQMLEKIGELVRDKKIEGIAEMRDESDKQGVRVVIETKRDAVPDVVLSQLYAFSQLQTSFSTNILALDKGRPRLMNVKDVLVAFCNFREEVVTRRTNFLLSKARDRAHILIGLSMAVANIDEIITIIKTAPDPSVAKERLLAKAWPAIDVRPLIELVAEENNIIVDGLCYFTEIQAKAILDMRLARLTGLEQEKINNELSELALEIKDYLDILSSRERVIKIIKEELMAVKLEFATPRKTNFEESEFESDIEDLIPREDMVVTVTMNGYIKRVPLSTYRAQKRGGKGRSGVSMHEEDVTTKVIVTNTHTPMLFFSSKGKVYKLKVYKLPLGTPQSRGRALVNIFPLDKDEAINVFMALPEDESLWEVLNIVFATNQGSVRRNHIDDFRSVQSNGKIAMKLDEGDKLVNVNVCSEDQHVVLATKFGKAVRFPVSKLRVFKGRNSTGVKGVKLAEKDEVVSFDIVMGADHITPEIKNAYLKIPPILRLKIKNLLQSQIAQAQLDQAFLGESQLGEAKVYESQNDDFQNENHKPSFEDSKSELLSQIAPELISEIGQDLILELATKEQFILTVTENGYGKRSSLYDYRVTNRGGSGIVNIVTSQRNGNVVASYQVNNADQLILVTEKGQMIRTSIEQIRIGGRNTQGVTIFRADSPVISVARIEDTGVSNDENLEEQGELDSGLQTDSDIQIAQVDKSNYPANDE